MEQLLSLVNSQRSELKDLLNRQQFTLESVMSQVKQREDISPLDLSSSDLLPADTSNPGGLTSQTSFGTAGTAEYERVFQPSILRSDMSAGLRRLQPTLKPAVIDENEMDSPPDPGVSSALQPRAPDQEISKALSTTSAVKVEPDGMELPMKLEAARPVPPPLGLAPLSGGVMNGIQENPASPASRYETSVTSPSLKAGASTGLKQNSVFSRTTVTEEDEPHWHDAVLFWTDRVSSFAVCLNAIAMMVEFEMSGQANALEVGLSDGSGPDFSNASPFFVALRIFFDVFFLTEFGIRVAVLRKQIMQDTANYFDFVLVIAGVIEMVLLLATLEEGDISNTLVGLALRSLSSLRAIRVLRVFRFCAGLQLLMKACQSFVTSLFWSMVLLGVCMLAGALVVGNLLQDYVRGNAELADRQWIWNYYGTTYRSWYTLYEITFAGNWPTMARPVLEKVSHGFVVFYVLYITIVVFALIRVITAVFLKDTLDSAHSDAELRISEGMRKRAEYVEKLENIFQAIDDTGDGMITEERLSFILENPKVKAYFQTLDLDVHETSALFRILDDGDGECTLEEFIGGIMRCKGQARAIDQLAMQADLKVVDRKITRMMRALSDSGMAGLLSQTASAEASPGSPECRSPPYSRKNSNLGSELPVSAKVSISRLSNPGAQSVISSQSAGQFRQSFHDEDIHRKKRRASEAAQMFLHRTALMGNNKQSSYVGLDDPAASTYIL